MTISE